MLYNKIYSLVGIGVGISLLCLGPLMMHSPSHFFRTNLTNPASTWLLRSGCRLDLGLCCKW